MLGWHLRSALLTRPNLIPGSQHISTCLAHCCPCSRGGVGTCSLDCCLTRQDLGKTETHCTPCQHPLSTACPNHGLQCWILPEAWPFDRKNPQEQQHADKGLRHQQQTAPAQRTAARTYTIKSGAATSSADHHHTTFRGCSHCRAASHQIINQPAAKLRQ